MKHLNKDSEFKFSRAFEVLFQMEIEIPSHAPQIGLRLKVEIRGSKSKQCRYTINNEKKLVVGEIVSRLFPDNIVRNVCYEGETLRCVE